MAQLAYQQTDINGVVLTLSPASAGGDTIPPDSRGMLLVQNSSAAAVTVTVAVPGNTKYGEPQPDVPSESIPASGFATIGPFPRDLADDADGLVHITYSASASVNVAAVRI